MFYTELCVENGGQSSGRFVFHVVLNSTGSGLSSACQMADHETVVQGSYRRIKHQLSRRR